MTEPIAAAETTPLLGAGAKDKEDTSESDYDPDPSRKALFAFLEAQTPGGRAYERFIIILIVLNVIAFILGSLFVEKYNDADWAKRDGGLCDNFCDAIWFGNYKDNGLEFLNMGATSVLEVFTVIVFSIEYLCRLHVADLEDPRFKGVLGRLRYIPTFFSVVDLASTVPFYIDVFFLKETDLVTSSFLRMFRLLRMMRVEGRYDTALTMVDDVYEAQKGVLGTALFVGITTWLTASSFYYLVERKNLDMIYCGAAPDYCRDEDGSVDHINTGDCVINDWGVTNCTRAGCPSSEEFPEPCYNLFQSIPMASYYTLLNLFGEFPLVDQHSDTGKFVATIVAIVAVAVFALPAGIIGNGFEEQIEAQRNQTDESRIVETGGRTAGFTASEDTFRGRLYNFLHAQTVPGSIGFDYFVNLLIVVTACTFVADTSILNMPAYVDELFDIVEFLAVVVFTLEYLGRVYSSQEDPKYNQGILGMLSYMTTFLAVVDLLSVVPYWIQVAGPGRIIDPPNSEATIQSNLVKALRLLRILRFEKYTHAFTSFDDVISRNLDVLSVTAFTAILCWILFGAFLYFTERDNPDPEMAENYSTVPNSMWITLLNLSGEAPLCQYSLWGKVATGFAGLFATGIFGIPIGILGAGFEQVVEEETEDAAEEPEAQVSTGQRSPLGTQFEQFCFTFVNGMGSTASRLFEGAIYALIFVAVTVGVWQTVEGHGQDFSGVEWLTVLVFTVEYIIRFIGVGADYEFAIPGSNAISSRLRFIFSFYSIVDLLAIVPFYITIAMPGSFVNDYDEYLRMVRIIRLVKLDKYVPSITLIDDVIRLKAQALKVAAYAALTLWILFAALLFLFEHDDSKDGIDPVPSYGCKSDCTMSDRFQNFFDSMVYTGIHLTGDYPIITYSWPARVVNFFMVIAAVGVVSIPSGLVASGFVEIVQSKTKKQSAVSGNQGTDVRGVVHEGDDWYEIQYRELEGVVPPPSPFGPIVDKYQYAVNEFLNGSEDESAGVVRWTFWSRATRIFIFVVIVANVMAVILESVPTIDEAVGNEPGNFFDVFEAFSVFVFAIEYLLRLFCAPKNREALYSSVVYATTFFGIVDFVSTAPWFIEKALLSMGYLTDGDDARMFRILRIFRILQLEDFIVAFSKLDNVFRASKDVLKATGLMALIIWVGCGALFFIFEENNPNWRQCDDSVPTESFYAKNGELIPGCYDFVTTGECNEYYDNKCEQKVFTNMPNSLYLTAVFLGGEWGIVDFTWPGRLVCLFLCVVGIGLYAIPIGALFDSFGAILGMGGDDDEVDEAGDDD